MTPDQKAEISRLLSQWDRPDAPGCAVGIIWDGQIIYSRGYGMADLDNGSHITPSSVFYVASMAKQFTAACVLLLAGRGHFSLDDDVHRYWPEFPKYGAPLTIRHLLCHTSGLRDDIDLWLLAGRSYEESFDNGDLVKLLLRQNSLNFVPGAEKLYSNANYLVLAELVRLLSGKSLRDFADDNIFQPLGMLDSFFDDGTSDERSRVISYRSVEDGPFTPYVHKFFAVGSGGLCTTVDDLSLWEQSFSNHRVPRRGLEEMLLPGRLDNGEEVNFAFGLQHGWHKGLRLVHSPGSMLGFRAQVLRFPEQGLSVICLANADSFDRFAVPRKLADIFLDDQFQVDGFVGDYYSGELDVTWTLFEKHGDMFFTYNNVVRGPLELASVWQLGFDKFRFLDDEMGVDIGVEFEKDGNSGVLGFTLSSYRVRSLRFAKT